MLLELRDNVSRREIGCLRWVTEIGSGYPIVDRRDSMTQNCSLLSGLIISVGWQSPGKNHSLAWRSFSVK